MSHSEIRLKPLIEKIVITDARETDAFHIEVKGLIDSETMRITEGIFSVLESRGYKPRAEVSYLGTVFRIGFLDEQKEP